MGRFVDYYALLNLQTTASPDEVDAALAAAEIRLRNNHFLSPMEAQDFARKLSRARVVLGDENNRMTYDILGKDVTEGIAEKIPVPEVAQPGQKSSPAEPFPEPPALSSDAEAFARMTAQPKPDPDRAFGRLCEDLDRKAERLKEMEGKKGQTLFGIPRKWIRLGMIVINLLVMLGVVYSLFGSGMLTSLTEYVKLLTNS